MSDKYDPLRLESFGLCVTMSRHQGDFEGTRDQLIDAGLAKPDDFPQGRRFIGCVRPDEFGNSRELRRVHAGHFRVRVFWSRDFEAWLRTEALIRARTDALPRSAAEYRALVRHAMRLAVDTLRRSHLERAIGGYRLKLDRAELLEAFAPWFQLLENAPVLYSPEARAAELRGFLAESAVLDPRAKAFVRKVTRPQPRPPAESGPDPAPPSKQRSTAA